MPTPEQELEGALNKLGAPSVRAFQQREGLKVDGIVGPQTDAALQDRVGARSRRLWVSGGLFAGLGIIGWVLWNFKDLFH